MNIKPGDLISLSQKSGATYQVVNLDDCSDCVWVRRWPLDAHRSPTFAVQSAEIRPILSEVTR
ncbi:MAG: hypothetical protein WAM11_11480 [Cyanobium sp.]